MPIYSYHCKPCGETFDGVTTVADYDRCPKCYRKSEQVFTLTRIRIGRDSADIDVDNMDPLEREMLLEHKSYIEANADTLTWKESGPKALRPFAGTR